MYCISLLHERLCRVIKYWVELFTHFASGSYLMFIDVCVQFTDCYNYIFGY